jgi:hypothetical protein
VPFGPEIGRYFARTWAVLSLGPAVAEQDEHLLRPVTRSWREQGRKITGVIGRPAGDAPLLALCAQLEAAKPWFSVKPPCW